MTKIRDMSKLEAAAMKMGITGEELRAFLPLMLEVQDEINKEKIKNLKKATEKAKGGNIEKQMEMFQDGGLKDEGNTVDPVSGNDVPPGATQEEVRDDIPAQLSEGEFVFPADVVRYIGLEKLMRLRQEAKMGLKMMEEMGQMGNADEATIPDDVPFSVIDINIAEDDEDEEVEKRAEGGVIEAANGFAGTTTTTNPLQQRQPNVAGAQTGIKTPYVAPTIPTATAAPIGGFKYKSPIDTTKKATYTGLFGGEELTQGPDEYRTYVNDAGAEIQIPFKNGELFTGFTIPEGFRQKTEDVTAKPQTTRIQTARVQSTQSDDDPEDPPGAVDLTGNTLSYKSIFGMDKLDTTMKGYANMQRGLFSPYDIGKRGITGQINANDIILSSAKLELQDIRNKLVSNYNIPNNFDFGNLGIYKQIENFKGGEQGLRDAVALKLNQHNEEIRATITNPRTGEIYTNKEFEEELEKYNVKTKTKKKGTNISVRRNIGSIVTDLKNAKLEEVARYQQDTGVRDKTDPESIRTAQQVAKNMKNASDYFGGDAFQSSYDPSDPSDVDDYSGSISDAGGSFVGDDPAFKQGGLAKRKVKPKKMKRGGLASR